MGEAGSRRMESQEHRLKEPGDSVCILGEPSPGEATFWIPHTGTLW